MLFRLHEEYEQAVLDLFAADQKAKEVCPSLEAVGHTSNFLNNMRLPVHRWFRYSAGFSALAGEWTGGAIRQMGSHGITLLHIPYIAVINSFRIKGIDLDYAEIASPSEKHSLVKSLKALPDS